MPDRTFSFSLGWAERFRTSNKRGTLNPKPSCVLFLSLHFSLRTPPLLSSLFPKQAFAHVPSYQMSFFKYTSPSPPRSATALLLVLALATSTVVQAANQTIQWRLPLLLSACRTLKLLS